MDRVGIHERIRELLGASRNRWRRAKSAKLAAALHAHRAPDHHPAAGCCGAGGAAADARADQQAVRGSELHFKAETARAKVPPEYRPRIERPRRRPGRAFMPLAPGAEFAAQPCAACRIMAGWQPGRPF